MMRGTDRRSPEAAAYRKLYKTKAWEHIRAQRLQADPLCRMCRKEGKVTPATVVNHKVPHKGDEALFFSYENTESLCAPHHDRDVQQIEKRGYASGVDENGWPTDPNHPANR